MEEDSKLYKHIPEQALQQIQLSAQLLVDDFLRGMEASDDIQDNWKKMKAYSSANQNKSH